MSGPERADVSIGPLTLRRGNFSIQNDVVCTPCSKCHDLKPIPDSFVLHREESLPEHMRMEGELFNTVLGSNYRNRLAQKTVAIMGAETGLGHLNPALAIMRELAAHGVGTVPYGDFERIAAGGSRHFRMEAAYWAALQAGVTRTQDQLRPLLEFVEGPTLKEDLVGIGNLALALGLTNEFKFLADFILRLSPKTGKKLLGWFLKQDIALTYAPTRSEIVQFLDDLGVDVIGGTHWGAIRALLSNPKKFSEWRNRVLAIVLDAGYGGFGQGFTAAIGPECPGAFAEVPTGGNLLSAIRYLNHQRERLFNFGATSPTPNFEAIRAKFSKPPYFWIIATGGNHSHLGTIYREIQDYVTAPPAIQELFIPIVYLAHHPDGKKSDGVSVSEIIDLINRYRDLPIEVIRTKTRLEAIVAFHDAEKRSAGIDTKGVDQAYLASGNGVAPVLYRAASPVNEVPTDLWEVKSGTATLYPYGPDGQAWDEILRQPYKIKRKLYGESLALSPEDVPLFTSQPSKKDLVEISSVEISPDGVPHVKYRPYRKEPNIWEHHARMMREGIAQQIVYNALVNNTHPYGICGQTLLLCAMALDIEGLDDMREGSPGWKLRRKFREYEATKKKEARMELGDFNTRPDLFHKIITKKEAPKPSLVKTLKEKARRKAIKTE